jgi:hypothetical protein
MAAVKRQLFIRKIAQSALSELLRVALAVLAIGW